MPKKRINLNYVIDYSMNYECQPSQKPEVQGSLELEEKASRRDKIATELLAFYKVSVTAY